MMKRKKWWILSGIMLLCFGIIFAWFREDIRILERKHLSPAAPVKKPRESPGFLTSRVIELTDEEYKLFQMVVSARINVFYGPFFADYRKSIEDALKIVPFHLDLGDTPNLRKQIVQYRTHIVNLIKEIESASTTRSDRNDSSNARLPEYRELLKRFDEDIFLFKAEFVQCLISGDDISKDAWNYLWEKQHENIQNIRALKGKHDSRKELDNLHRLGEFYTLLLCGMSIQDYYRQGEYNVGL